MAFINWDEKYSIGIGTIDDEHQEQIRLLNLFHDEFKKSPESPMLFELFENLLENTRRHFDNEENLMKKYSFPLYEEHRVSHDELILKAENLKEELRAGRLRFSFELVNFFKEWLMLHIMGSDLKYRDFILGKNQ
jgi:hemerythrin-like metal-binding protein